MTPVMHATAKIYMEMADDWRSKRKFNVKCTSSMPIVWDYAQSNSLATVSITSQYVDLVNSKSNCIYDLYANISADGTITYRDFKSHRTVSETKDKKVLFIFDSKGAERAPAFKKDVSFYGFLFPLGARTPQIPGMETVHVFPKDIKLFNPPRLGPIRRPYCLRIPTRTPPVEIITATTVTQINSQEHTPTTNFQVAPLQFQFKATILHHEVDIPLQEEQTIPTILDSGAGATAFINEEHATLYQLRKVKTATPIRVTYANGEAQVIDHIVKVPLRINGAKFTVQAAVVPNLSQPLILGDHWLREHKAILNYGDNSLKLTRANGQVIKIHFGSGHHEYVHAPIQTIGEAKILSLTAEDTAKIYKQKEVADAWIFVVKTEPLEPEKNPPEAEFSETLKQVIPGDSPAELRLKATLQEYKSVFPAELPATLPPIREGWTNAIDTQPDAHIPGRPMFRYSQLELKEMERQVQEMLQKGLIEPSTSPFGAPILFVRKKTGELRMCIDYRALNKITIKNRYPLPRIDDLFDRLQGATTFSSLDLLSGYYQIRLTPADIPKTAFRTTTGLYQYKVLPMGLTNAPSVFMAAMNRILSDLKFAIVYLDDILIFSKSPEEHIKHVEAVLQRLKQHTFYAKLKKCDFFKKEIKFLGHIVSAEGVSPDPQKVAVVKSWPTPQNVNEIRAFLGLANYFRKFIENYSGIAAPLTSLMKGKQVSKRKGKTTYLPLWDKSCDVAFQTLKDALTNAPVLALPDYDIPFEVTAYEVVTDASDFAIGAILTQHGRPIAYESKKLTSAERNYHTTDRELLAVIHALQTWRCYLEGPKFRVVTDHHALTHLKTQPTLSRRQARWSEFLQGFNFEWEYRPGVTCPADPLSRMNAHKPSNNPEEEPPISIHQNHWSMKEGTSVLAAIRADGATRASQRRDEIEKLCITGYAEDPWFQKPANLEKLDLSNGLYFKDTRVVVPAGEPLKRIILSLAHSAPMAGHGGVARTYHFISRHYWWPGMKRDVLQYVKECTSCQAVKSSRQKAQGLLMPLPIPDQRWWTITMDFITDLPTSTLGHDSIYVFCDKLSKMIHLAPTTKTCDAKEAARLFITTIVKLHGLPREMVSDRDSKFTSIFWQEVMRILDIRSSLSTAFHPQTDGQTERTNQVVEDYLRHYIDAAQTNWEELLPMAEFAYNNAFHTATQTTPFLLNYGIEPLTPLSLLSDSQRQKRQEMMQATPAAFSFTERMQKALQVAKKWLEAAQQRDKRVADRKRRNVEYNIGDNVLLSSVNLKLKDRGTRKLLPRFLGPFPITEVVNSNAYRLHLPKSLKCHNVFHVGLLKRYIPGSNENPPPLPEVIDEIPEYEVEKILGHKTKGKGKHKKLFFLVRWKGYESDYDTWEPESNISHSPIRLQQYWKSVGKLT